MNHTSYREQDHVFGQMMLNLRTVIGLTQAGLAELLKVSRHAIGGWETGQSYPKAEHLKHFIALCLAQRAFTVGHEAEEARALWRTARQKVLLDEAWLQDVLNRQGVILQPTPHLSSGSVASLPVTRRQPHLDWGDALDVPNFYGRVEERALVSRWVVEEGCRVVSVLGMGGIGKSALVTHVMRQVAPHFQAVIWRSLRDTPSCETLVASCIQVISPELLHTMPASVDERLDLLMKLLREERVLLVFDNFEVLLEEDTGRLRPILEGYARLLRRIGETVHRSCLLLTSREKLAELVPLEGSRSLVRSMRLSGLDAETGAHLLVEKDIVGSASVQKRLIDLYQGNPLALKIVAQTIVELYGGEIEPFLAHGTVIFGGVRVLLDEQFKRLSALDQTIVYWLAILREPISLAALTTYFNTPHTSVTLLEALERLGRRSLIERGQPVDGFTVQSVVLEYATARLIEEASNEIVQGRLARLIEHGLCQAHAKDYVRQTQERLLLTPLLARLQTMDKQHIGLEQHLLLLIDQLRNSAVASQGYGPANLVALLQALRGNLRGLDFSRLALREAYLQGVEMQDTDLRGSVLQGSIFTDSFDEIFAVAISSSGTYWAAVSRFGQIRVWEDEGRTLSHMWQSHTDLLYQHLAFSPDGRMLVSVGYSGGARVRDVVSGTLCWSAWLNTGVTELTISPDGKLLTTASRSGTLQLWDMQDGTLVEELPHARSVEAQTWSPAGLLATGDSAGTIRIWQLQQGEPTRCVQTLTGYAEVIVSLAFDPTGEQLASAYLDYTFKLWEVASGRCLHSFSDGIQKVSWVSWNPDGRTIVTSGDGDGTIWLWDTATLRPRAALRGHTSYVISLACTPDSRTLLTGSLDGTIRVWDVERCQCVQTMYGYVTVLQSVDWSPDGTHLASGGTGTSVTVWDVANAVPARTLHGYRVRNQEVAWQPGGTLLARSEDANGISIWDTTTGALRYQLHNPDILACLYRYLAWSPDGQLLACTTSGQGVHVWDIATRTRRWVGQTQTEICRHIAWSPDGTQLAGSNNDGMISLWHAADGRVLRLLAQHSGDVISVAWRPDGRWLASGGGVNTSGELFVWDAHSGVRLHTLASHPHEVTAVAWSSTGEMLVSGCADGALRWWEIASGRCLRVQTAHEGVVYDLKRSPDGQRLASCGNDGAIMIWDLHTGEHLQTLRRDRPYERMNITDLTGITDAQRASLLALGAIERGDR